MATYKTQFGEKPPVGSGAGFGERPDKDGNWTFQQKHCFFSGWDQGEAGRQFLYAGFAGTYRLYVDH